ncbi:hypothetical protein AVEN_90581-1 [Araneus ventricosus]|uniref:Uncharacterized protein n=1 Tax=Araneus ventricosus TaxID=182803 RepID=A0A4Y2VUW0_ARAVE|nr:hypothetical protein AVEN_90581-1 [Araneus ventricosus]
MEFEGLSYQPTYYEERIKSLTIYSSLFNIINQISTTEPYKEDNNLIYFTDGSKTEMGTECSYCTFEDNIKVLVGKIRKFPHSVSGRINGTERSDHQSKSRE